MMLFLASCTTFPLKNQWPQELPPKYVFVDAYVTQANSPPSEQQISQHLNWIVKFYRGSLIYPYGWNDMTSKVLASLENDTDREIARSKLNELGILIAIEWAQENNVRRIDSGNISVWGTALRKSAKNGDQLYFIEQVTHDVNLMLDDQLLTKDISHDRYYSEEDFDDF